MVHLHPPPPPQASPPPKALTVQWPYISPMVGGRLTSGAVDPCLQVLNFCQAEDNGQKVRGTVVLRCSFLLFNQKQSENAEVPESALPPPPPPPHRTRSGKCSRNSKQNGGGWVGRTPPPHFTHLPPDHKHKRLFSLAENIALGFTGCSAFLDECVLSKAPRTLTPCTSGSLPTPVMLGCVFNVVALLCM